MGSHGQPGNEGERRVDGPLGATRGATSPDLDDPDDARSDDDLTPSPREIGRFVVLRRLGRGSMGEVYSAFDDDLGRRVSIKLLRRQPRAHESRRARMRREAQAMAQVSHPNVIKVFEVGEHGDRTFIAMEYVEGQTLERWQRGVQDQPRSREELLAAYLQAGAGLAAAHRAGVLHRDFKPSNVLVDAEGHAHVMDFGLAAWLRRGDASATDSGRGSSAEGAELFESREQPRLTRAGAVLGTPAFMSPEQYLQQPLDARSDQFSFCVALWEALTGVHPFQSDDLEGLRTAILNDQAREGPSSRPLSLAVKRALRRGMAKVPSERWPSMDALLDALRPRPRRARWPWAVAAAVVVAAVGVSYGVTQRRAGLCEGSPEQLARVWNDERRAAAQEGLLHIGAPLAEAMWPRVEADLDEYAEQWTAIRQRVCEATHVRGEQSPALMDERMACLDLRLHAMAGLLATFEQADLETMLRAVDASASLPDAAECELAGVGSLADAEATRPEAAELRRRLVTASGRLEVGRLADAHAELDAIRDEALVLGLPRLAAEALVERGQAEVALGRASDADPTLDAAVWEAVAQGHDSAALEAAVRHLELVGVTLGEHERGRAGIARSEALLERLGNADVARIEYLTSSGEVLGRHGDFREAKARLDEALALAREAHGTEHVVYGRVLDAVGAVALWGADFDEAERVFTELVELDRRLYARSHPMVAAALNNLAIVMANKGDLDAAEQRFREVLEIRRRTLGDTHLSTADALMNLAGIAHARAQPAAGLPLLEQARAVYAVGLGQDAAKTVDVDTAIGMLLLDLDRDAEAEPILRGVLANQRRNLGERHPDLTRVLGALGRLLTRPADVAEAVELLRLAVEIRRATLESSGVPLAQDLVLGQLEKNLAKAEAMQRGEPPPTPAAAPPVSPSQ